MALSEGELERMIGDTWPLSIPPLCPKCGYNLMGITQVVCPECGSRHRRRDVLSYSSEIQYRLRRIKGINETLQFASRFAMAGLVLQSLRFTPICTYWAVNVMTSLAGFVVGMASLSLGLTILPFVFTPRWERSYQTDRPRYDLSLAAVIFGILNIAACFLA